MTPTLASFLELEWNKWKQTLVVQNTAFKFVRVCVYCKCVFCVYVNYVFCVYGNYVFCV
jgi:hypothetical protein